MTTVDPDLHDAAFNAVAVAAVAYRQERCRLVHILTTAHRHGLDVAELAEASGMPADVIATFLDEGAE
jgi:hypothetical protein